MGGVPRKTAILTEFENFFQEWSRFAISNSVDLIKITEVKDLLYLLFLQFTRCSRDTKDMKILKEYLENNEDLVFLCADKSKNISVFDKNDYLQKLSDDYLQKLSDPNLNPLKIVY